VADRGDEGRQQYPRGRVEDGLVARFPCVRSGGAWWRSVGAVAVRGAHGSSEAVARRDSTGALGVLGLSGRRGSQATEAARPGVMMATSGGDRVRWRPRTAAKDAWARRLKMKCSRTQTKKCLIQKTRKGNLVVSEPIYIHRLTDEYRWVVLHQPYHHIFVSDVASPMNIWGQSKSIQAP
jgi:hypothetical protein